MKPVSRARPSRPAKTSRTPPPAKAPVAQGMAPPKPMGPVGQDAGQRQERSNFAQSAGTRPRGQLQHASTVANRARSGVEALEAQINDVTTQTWGVPWIGFQTFAPRSVEARLQAVLERVMGPYNRMELLLGATDDGSVGQHDCLYYRQPDGVIHLAVAQANTFYEVDPKTMTVFVQQGGAPERALDSKEVSALITRLNVNPDAHAPAEVVEAARTQLNTVAFNPVRLRAAAREHLEQRDTQGVPAPMRQLVADTVAMVLAQEDRNLLHFARALDATVRTATDPLTALAAALVRARVESTSGKNPQRAVELAVDLMAARHSIREEARA